MLFMDKLGGVSLYNTVKLATNITYLPYRHGDRFFFSHEPYGKVGEQIARAAKGKRLQKYMYTALDYAYNYCHLQVGNWDSKENFKQGLLGELDSGKDIGHWLYIDNHDAFIIHAETGKYYYLLSGDWSYWLWEVEGTPDMTGYLIDNPQYARQILSTVQLPRIGQ